MGEFKNSPKYQVSQDDPAQRKCRVGGGAEKAGDGNQTKERLATLEGGLRKGGGNRRKFSIRGGFLDKRK